MALEKGCYSSITDVDGVKVGHVTLYKTVDDEDTICTGVTAILPHSENLFRKKVRAGDVVINGFGKSTGLIQIEELGIIESPNIHTNNLYFSLIHEGVLSY